MTFEAGKEYKTRDGSRARVYATDGVGPFPIHGAIYCPNDGTWRFETWGTKGNNLADAEPFRDDLMPPTRTVWVVVWVARYGGEPPCSSVHSNAYFDETAARNFAKNDEGAFPAVITSVEVPV